VLIPAFSVGRTQNMLMFIKDLMAEKAIPETEVFMDSPMAISATDIYIRHKADHKLSEEVIKNDDSFLTLGRNLITVRTQEASRYLNNKTEGAIIISASGMMNGGRILHHLFHRLPNKNDTLMIVGYQAVGTRGRRILEGEKFAKIFGQLVPVNCHVEEVRGLSAHADQVELKEWLKGFEESPKMTFVIHGEENSAEAMKTWIERDFGWNVIVPNYLENVELFRGI
jgi:metallo-beta-lactamase family protein